MNYDLPPNYNLLGIDLATNEAGDLTVDPDTLDFGVIRGPNNAVTAFIRELITPLGYIGRYVYDYQGIKALDEDYGNPIYAIISEPMTQEWLSESVEYIKQIARDHPRISVTSVNYEILNDSSTNILFTVNLSVETFPSDYSLIIQRGVSGLQIGLMEGQ